MQVTEKPTNYVIMIVHRQANVLTNILLLLSPSFLPHLSRCQPVSPPLPGFADEALPVSPCSSPARYPPAAGAPPPLSASLTPSPAGTPPPGTPPGPVCVFVFV